MVDMLIEVLIVVATVAGVGLIAWGSDQLHKERLEEHMKAMEDLYRTNGRGR